MSSFARGVYARGGSAEIAGTTNNVRALEAHGQIIPTNHT
jgi:hypothetical protein